MPADYKLPLYTIYVDTNVAYSKKPSEPISGKLVKFATAVRARTQVSLRMPEVVVEELTYQQFKIAESAAENLKKNFNTLRSVCGMGELKIPDLKELKVGAKEVVVKAIEAGSFVVLPTPIDAINWQAVVHESCWRHPPFQKPKSDDDLAEKGFRDKVILETIKLDAAASHSGVIAFVSGDNLLRATFKEQTESPSPIEVYVGFDEFIGHLDLLTKTKSSQFAEEVLSKVNAFFYDPRNPGCVVLSQGVLEHLAKEHSEEMTRPPLFSTGPPKYPQSIAQPPTSSQWSSAPSVPFQTWLSDFSAWAPVSPLKFFPSASVFQSPKGDGRYHWISTVTLAQLLRKTEPQRGEVYGFPEEKIRTKDVDVKWNCNIDADTATFSDPRVEGYVPSLRDAFLEADWRSRTAYDLPMFPTLERMNS
jgi:PIN domain